MLKPLLKERRKHSWPIQNVDKIKENPKVQKDEQIELHTLEYATNSRITTKFY